MEVTGWTWWGNPKYKDLEDVDAVSEEPIWLNGYDVVFKNIKEHGYHFDGYAHQNAEFGVPILDDKYLFQVTQRTWGAIIAKAFPEEFDDADDWRYVRWYLGAEECCKEQIKIPDGSLWVE